MGCVCVWGVCECVCVWCEIGHIGYSMWCIIIINAHHSHYNTEPSYLKLFYLINVVLLNSLIRGRAFFSRGISHH